MKTFMPGGMLEMLISLVEEKPFMSMEQPGAAQSKPVTATTASEVRGLSTGIGNERSATRDRLIPS
jgi:hypothetical protein